ncbi:Rrf2 family transcriptional regulator [Sulfuriflexus sp.]|uniref:Rrf2 family transcriptional regulator n=1 Tax=Sulfuriflexus sp. TaxID=2015443 RepID=UPI0028CE80CF|nr:Rrf2 family transcriptional regulator [Sulfuriflexus sp.]MDT8405176.1 Rrf2 family transcriptional regulator [Sulfuriflexus sp.]
MKLSSRSQYAITAMLELAIQEKIRPVTLFDIAQKQRISLSYLEQLFAHLRQNALVRGRRGPGGGYVLARNVKDISIADIVMAVDDTGVKPAKEAVMDRTEMSSEQLWQDVSQRIYGCLSDITLGDFLRSPSNGPMPESPAKAAG